MEAQFWKGRTLESLSGEEWEALCDGCGRCCLEKLEDEDSGEVLYTRVACKLLDIGTCRCMHYAKRHEFVPDCLPILPSDKKIFAWLPATCAYKLLHEGKNLPAWHYLISGTRETVHKKKISIRHEAIPTHDNIDLEEHILGEL